MTAYPCKDLVLDQRLDHDSIGKLISDASKLANALARSSASDEFPESCQSAAWEVIGNDESIPRRHTRPFRVMRAHYRRTWLLKAVTSIKHGNRFANSRKIVSSEDSSQTTQARRNRSNVEKHIPSHQGIAEYRYMQYSRLNPGTFSFLAIKFALCDAAGLVKVVSSCLCKFFPRFNRSHRFDPLYILDEVPTTIIAMLEYRSANA